MELIYIIYVSAPAISVMQQILMLLLKHISQKVFCEKSFILVDLLLHVYIFDLIPELLCIFHFTNRLYPLPVLVGLRQL